jgi:hypothetical protein
VAGFATDKIRAAALLVHAALALAVGATMLDIDAAAWVRAVLLGVTLVPVAATAPALIGLRHNRLRWLALVLVLFAGLGSMEVIATGTVAAAVLLLSALLELGLVLILVRRPLPRAHDAPGVS